MKGMETEPLYRFVDHWTLYVCPGCGAWSDAEGYCCIPENHAEYVKRVPVKVAPLATPSSGSAVEPCDHDDDPFFAKDHVEEKGKGLNDG